MKSGGIKKEQNQKKHIKTHIKAGRLFEISSENTYGFSFKYGPRPPLSLTLSVNTLISDQQVSE